MLGYLAMKSAITFLVEGDDIVEVKIRMFPLRAAMSASFAFTSLSSADQEDGNPFTRGFLARALSYKPYDPLSVDF